MKKILFILLASSFGCVAQTPIAGFPTYTVNSENDYLLVGKAAGGLGATNKKSIADFLSTYSIAIAGVIPLSMKDKTVTLTSSDGCLIISGVYPSFTITNSCPDRTVTLTSSNSQLNITGTYPNFTFSVTSSGNISGSGTATYYSKFTNSVTIGNALLFDQGNCIIVPSAGKITSQDTNRISMEFGTTGFEQFTVRTKGATNNSIVMDTLTATIGGSSSHAQLNVNLNQAQLIKTENVSTYGFECIPSGQIGSLRGGVEVMQNIGNQVLSRTAANTQRAGVFINATADTIDSNVNGVVMFGKGRHATTANHNTTFFNKIDVAGTGTLTATIKLKDGSEGVGKSLRDNGDGVGIMAWYTPTVVSTQTVLVSGGGWNTVTQNVQSFTVTNTHTVTLVGAGWNTVTGTNDSYSVNNTHTVTLTGAGINVVTGTNDNYTITGTEAQTLTVNTASVTISTTNSYFAIGALGTASVSTSGNNILIKSPTDNSSFTNGAGYITGNQTITLTGPVTGSGTTTIATSIGTGSVTNAMLNGSIAASKLIGTDITTVGGITVGSYSATAIGASYGGTGITTYTVGDIIYCSSTNVLSKLSKGSDGQLLGLSNGLPTWTTSAGTVYTAGSGLSLNSSNTFSIAPAAITNAMLANSAVANLSGTNTGDQTISLTGVVTGSGTGSFATTISTGSVIGTMIANSAVDLTTKVTGTLPVTNGGTGLITYSIGDIVAASALTTLSGIHDVAAGSYFRSGGLSTIPLWSTLILPNSATTGYVPYATATNTWGENVNFQYDASGVLRVVNTGTTSCVFSRTDNNNNINGVLVIRKSRADAAQPGVGMGAMISYNLEGSVAGTQVFVGGIGMSWESAQSNATTQRNSNLIFTTMLANTTAEAWRISSSGALSNTGSAGNAYIELKAGTATAGTSPLKFTAGTPLTVPVSGVVEVDANNNIWYTNSTGVRGKVDVVRTFTTSASTYTVTVLYSHDVFTGTTSTWTLPAVSGNTNMLIRIKNRGSGTITLNANAGAAEIYTTSAVTTMNILAGEAYTFINDGSVWDVH